LELPAIPKAPKSFPKQGLELIPAHAFGEDISEETRDVANIFKLVDRKALKEVTYQGR